MLLTGPSFTKMMVSISPYDDSCSGVLANQVLDYVIKDIAEVTVEGLDCYHTSGSKANILLHIFELSEGYSAFLRVINVMEYMAVAPCMHCTFPHQKARRLNDVSSRRRAHTQLAGHFPEASVELGRHETQIFLRQYRALRNTF